MWLDHKKRSNGVINFSHSNAFNEWINTWGLMEIRDPSRSFTWSNNQDKLMMAILERILTSTDWDGKFPRANVTILPKEVSDHNPLMIKFGIRRQIKKSYV
jgi:hypothetical protein